jgi:hypothetical protein
MLKQRRNIKRAMKQALLFALQQSGACLCLVTATNKTDVLNPNI